MNEHIITALENAVTSLQAAEAEAHHEAVSRELSAKDFMTYKDTIIQCKSLALKVEVLRRWFGSRVGERGE